VVTELLFVVAEVTVEVIAVVASVSLPPVESLVPVLESLELPLTPEVPLLSEPPLVELADSPPVLPESESEVPSESLSAAVALSSSPLLSQPRPPRPRTRAAEIMMFRPCRVMGGPYHRSSTLALWRVCQAPDSDVMAASP
jgi:hypothetical protein